MRGQLRFGKQRLLSAEIHPHCASVNLKTPRFLTELKNELTRCCFDLSLHTRAQIPQTKESPDPEQGGQTAPDGLQYRAAAAAESGVPEKPLPHRAAQAEPGFGAEPQRVSDQNLVPEQTGQDQKGVREEQLPGAAPDGAGTVQPLRQQGGPLRQRLKPSEQQHPGPGDGHHNHTVLRA